MKTPHKLLVGAFVGVVLVVGGSAVAANVVKRFQGTVVADRFNGAILAIAGTDITATAAELNYNDVTTAGTAQGSKAMVLSSAKTLATVTQFETGNLLLDNYGSTITASADVSTATLHAFQVFLVDTTAGAVDLDFSDSALNAADIGATWKFIQTAGTNALTITAGDAGVTTIKAVDTDGAACEDIGDYFTVQPYSTAAATVTSYCAD